MSNWRLRQLTFGSDSGLGHSHSYYDIPVADAAGRRVLVHRLDFTERHPDPGDTVRVGIVDVDHPGDITWLGESGAWSWQQGPMAQWIGGGPWAVWNDREDGKLIARIRNVDTAEERTLPRPVYAVTPDGRTALGLDMARLHHLRPGYGYPVDTDRSGLPRAPDDNGIWSMSLDSSGAPRLILDLRTASQWLHRLLPMRDRVRHAVRRYYYWFNHVKISPDGSRFTVKLRWRQFGKPWNSTTMGVSLTAALDGSDLRLLSRGTSHVIWQTSDRLYCWSKEEWGLYQDTAPRGTRLGLICDGVIDCNVHLRHIPPTPTPAPPAYVYDVRDGDRVHIHLLDPSDNATTHMATFDNHVPAVGPFRCDPHPVPSEDGRRVFVTSLQDGARQLYCFERNI
ncbi:MAG: hypothetical protein AAF376_02775 [Pseudomonadota bacterium]